MDDQIKKYLDYIKDHSTQIEFNGALLDITEGDLMSHIRKALSAQLESAKNVEIAMQRAAPINVWNKIVKKLSKLYAQPPKRTTENDSDLELVKYYEKNGIDQAMADTNFNYNNYKWTSLEIFEDEKEEKLRFRSVPSNMFLAYSDDPIDPLRVTAIIKFMGMYEDGNGDHRSRFWVYTDDSFIAFLDNGNLVPEDMLENEGENPFETIPFEYVNMSRNFLVPNPDKDTIQMTVNIPVLITDMNFASLYLSIPIIYTINVDADKLPQSPNAMWNLKAADPDAGTPVVNVLKPEPNLAAQMNNVKDQLAMWLETRDIKAGSIGSLNSENFASGISKIISEMDTLENRNEQKVVFKAFEVNLWRRIAKMHNYLADNGRTDNRGKFSDPSTLVVDVEYTESAVIESRTDKVLRLKEEVENGFKSRNSAIKELNPHMSEGEIAILLKEIEEESTLNIEGSDVQNEEVTDAGD